MGDLNINTNIPSGQASGAQGTDATAEIVKADQQRAEQQDSMISQANLKSNLSADYQGNSARPILQKPPLQTENKNKATTERDTKAEDNAGTQGSSSEVDASDNQADLPITEQKPQEEGEGQQGKGGGDQGGGDGEGKGFSSYTPGPSTDELAEKLNKMLNKGETLPDIDPKDIKNFLQQAMGANAKKVPESFMLKPNLPGTPNEPGTNPKTATKGQNLTGAAASAGPLTEDEPNLFEFTVSGNSIIGPQGTMEIPGPAPNPKTTSDVLFNTYHLAKDTVNVQQSLILQMPDGPDKFALATFLARVTSALNKFQQALYSLNAMTSQQIRGKTQGQLELALKKINDQYKQMEEQREKQKDAEEKQKVSGILNKVFGVVGIIMSVVMVIAFCWMGPLALFAVTFMVVSIASTATQLATNKSLFQRLFEALDSLMGTIMDAAGIGDEAQSWLKLLTKLLIVVVICIIVIATNPLMFLMGGVSNVTSFITDSGIIGDFVGNCGGDEKAKMITTIVVTGVIMMITMIFNIAMMFIPGTQATIFAQVGSAVAKVAQTVVTILSQVLQFVLKVTEKTAETAMQIIKLIAKFVLNPGFWLSLSMLGLQTAQTVNSIKMQKLLADLALLQGRMDKETAEIDALIAVLKKMIQKLLENLGDVAAFITQTGNLIKKNYASASETMTDLWAASSRG